MARSTHPKRTRTDIPLLTPPAISIVRRKKIKTSTEKVPPVAKISIAMKKTKIAIVMIRTNVSRGISKYICVIIYFMFSFLIACEQLVAKHREEKEKKDKEEIKVKEESNVKMNHAINEGFHYNMEIKCELKEVRFRLQLRFGE